MRNWLFKTEPTTFSWDDLWRAPDRTSSWDGVRNYAARNFMREMRKGDLGFLYHSSADPTAIIGVVEIVREAYPDATQFDSKDSHFDPKSKREEPTWSMVDVRARQPFTDPVTLTALRAMKGLEKMELLRKGNRLSVMPVSAEEWKIICKLGGPTSAGSR